MRDQSWHAIRTKQAGGRFGGKLLGWASSDYSFILPALFYLLLIVVFPTLYALRLSLQRWNLTEATPARFVGLSNYFGLVVDDRFWLALVRTFIFIVATSAMSLVLGLGLALLLNRPLPGKNVFRTLLIVPMLMSPVVVGLTWRFMYNPELGMINYALGLLGFEPIAFLGRTETALAALIVTDVWEYTPFALLILLAALESLPREPFEAAEIDGASSFQVFRWLALPMLRYPLLVAVVFRLLLSFNTFDTIYVMTGGGPGRSSETLMMYNYRLAFQQWHMGESAALSIIMLVIVTVASKLILRLIPRV